MDKRSVETRVTYDRDRDEPERANNGSVLNFHCCLAYTMIIRTQHGNTYTAVEMMAITYLGMLAKKGATVIKLVQTVYIVGAHALGVVRDNSTSKNLPKPPVGWRIAAIRPPTSLPFPRPACHVGTDRAAEANAAPRRCTGTCHVLDCHCNANRKK